MSRPRRILQLIDTGGPGGAETVFARLAASLEPERWKVVPVVPEEDWLSGRLHAEGVETVLLPNQRPFDLGYLGGIVRLIRRSRVRLLHAHLLGSSVYGCLAASVCRIPAICTFHGEVDLEASGRIHGLKLRIVGARARRVVFVSDSLRRRALPLLGVARERTAVIHNGIDTSEFSPREDDSFRRELGLGGDVVLIGAVGNIRPAKNYALLLEAAALLRLEGGVRFVIVGVAEGAPYEELLRLRSERDLEAVVTFAGFRSDVPRVLGSLDVYVSSSSSEGFSLTTVEALASGVPVVATRSGGPEEILDRGRYGILVEPDSPRALAEGILALVRDPGFASRLAREGRALVERRFSVETMLRRYEDVYERCLRPGA